MLSLLFFLGAVGKSAQIFLHTWLPSAMEGPTPVSALIHAATMVTAGVSLLIKCAPIIENSVFILSIIAISGVVTSFFAASSGLLLSDIKKVIAYSTCSQLGYMIFSCGFSAYNISLFHLMNHAVSKALLFLCAGAIIHSVSNEQDMRRMGGLLKVVPLAYSTFFVASLAIMGFPYLTGFFSKDVILETAAHIYGGLGLFVHCIASVTALFTAMYSMRLLYSIFIVEINLSRKYMLNLHESPSVMAHALIILAIGSIFSGFFFKDLLIGPASFFLTANIRVISKSIFLFDAEFLKILIKLIPLIVGLFGFSFLFGILYYWKYCSLFYAKRHNAVFRFFSNKWHFDYIYNVLINTKVLKIAKKYIYLLTDKGLLEIIGPFGFEKVIRFSGHGLTVNQDGYIGKYLFYMLMPFAVLSYLLLSESLIFEQSVFVQFFSFFCKARSQRSFLWLLKTIKIFFTRCTYLPIMYI